MIKAYAHDTQGNRLGGRKTTGPASPNIRHSDLPNPLRYRLRYMVFKAIPLRWTIMRIMAIVSQGQSDFIFMITSAWIRMIISGHRVFVIGMFYNTIIFLMENTVLSSQTLTLAVIFRDHFEHYCNGRY